jgi:protein phosphatase
MASPLRLRQDESMSLAYEYSVGFALSTHPGQLRPHNEDALGADPASGLFVLADGLGGYNAGEIASTMAVSTLLSQLPAVHQRARVDGQAFDPRQVLRDALISMNVAISRAAMNSSAYEGMATTIVLCWLLGRTLWVAHAGDSRLYRLRGGELEQLTRDHSFSQELLDAGMVTEEEARHLPSKNLVTRALGASPEVEPEINDFNVRAGDLLLLCSDGLTEMVSDRDIETQLETAGDDIESAAARLVDLANEAGGRDNISVLLVRIAENSADREPWRTQARVDATAEAADGMR